MPRRISNRDRIARMAAEKAAGKAAGKKEKTSASSAKAAPEKSATRMKLVWLVCDNAGEPVKSFAFGEFEAAKEEAAKLSEKKGKLHFVRKDKAPLE
jgi:hypothetical protein